MVSLSPPQRVVQVSGGNEGIVLLGADIVLAVIVIPVTVAAAVADKALVPPGQPAVAVVMIKEFRILADALHVKQEILLLI